jgi:hypothetical protein
MEVNARPGMVLVHPTYGKGTIIKVDTTFYTVQFPNRGNLDISKRTEGLELMEDEPEPTAEEEALSMPLVERTLRRILEEYSDIQQTVPLGERWQGGNMILEPADKALKSKKYPWKCSSIRLSCCATAYVYLSKTLTAIKS